MSKEFVRREVLNCWAKSDKSIHPNLQMIKDFFPSGNGFRSMWYCSLETDSSFNRDFRSFFKLPDDAECIMMEGTITKNSLENRTWDWNLASVQIFYRLKNRTERHLLAESKQLGSGWSGYEYRQTKLPFKLPKQQKVFSGPRAPHLSYEWSETDVSKFKFASGDERFF